VKSTGPVYERKGLLRALNHGQYSVRAFEYGLIIISNPFLNGAQCFWGLYARILFSFLSAAGRSETKRKPSATPISIPTTVIYTRFRQPYRGRRGQTVLYWFDAKTSDVLITIVARRRSCEIIGRVYALHNNVLLLFTSRNARSSRARTACICTQFHSARVFRVRYYSSPRHHGNVASSLRNKPRQSNKRRRGARSIRYSRTRVLFLHAYYVGTRILSNVEHSTPRGETNGRLTAG